MSLQNYEDLTESHFDVLKEICNIGSGNAATSLSDMFGVSIDIQVPEISIVDYDDAIVKLGGAETVIAGVMLTINGGMNGMIMFLLTHEFASMLLRTLMSTEIRDLYDIDEVGFSAIHETANIAAASFVNAISFMTDMLIDISPPVSAIDMTGAIMSAPAVYCANISDKLLFMENRFIWQGKESPAHILITPDVESLEHLMTRLGIDT